MTRHTSPDEENADPRYELVRSLQETLAEQLNAADLLLAQIENVAAEVRDDITRRESGADVTSASVANAVYEENGMAAARARSTTVRGARTRRRCRVIRGVRHAH